MHQLIPGAQQVLHVEDHEVITRVGDHLAEQGRGDGIEQTEDETALIQSFKDGGLTNHGNPIINKRLQMIIVVNEM
ncbi:hypothetical protein D3C85_1619970 [compost metagenome]